jgi:predicted CXXCH cytochrome family protein
VRDRLLIILGIAALLMLPAATTFGWAEGGVYDVQNGRDLGDCSACHGQEFFFANRGGPHGGYTSTTTRCAECHTVHVAGGPQLLPAATIKDTCNFCHDGTGGGGVYGSIAARGLTVGASHHIDTTNTVPGGDGTTGGNASVAFGGQGGALSCDDCHSPHDANTVQPYSSERIRFHATDRNWLPVWSSSHLLKQRPTGSDTTATVYGSDWCLGCHKGRRSGTALHNHPADSLTTTATPFYFDRVAVVTSDTATNTTVLGTMGLAGFVAGSSPGSWQNRGYVMPYPRTAQQQGHAPICQQCHENSRQVGTLGALAHAEVYRFGDGLTSGDAGTDNPLFQNFPHETVNAKMLVETNDDLCLNCHPADKLP